MDNQIVNELINVLDQETRIYNDVFRISKNKTNIIVEGKVAELENIVKIEQSLVLQIGRLENIREDLVDKLAEQFNIKADELSISELMKHVQSGQVHKLKVCQDNMSNIVNELKNANERNSKLIKNSLDYINFSVNLIMDAGMGENNYGSSGQIGSSKKRNLFDMKL